MPDELITPERKAEIEKQAKLNLEFVQREYWRLRNGKSRFMRCPYCTNDARRKNWLNSREMCCYLFANAFEAILDRQDEVDKGLAMADQVGRMLKANGYVN